MTNSSTRSNSVPVQASMVKNTLILYIRTALVLFLALFCTRLIVSMLGNEDFGITNVISSVVMLSYFLHNALTAMTQRYLAYEVGKGNTERIKHNLHNAVFLHIVLALIAVALLETIGLWFFLNKLNIPIPRQATAIYVFHATVAVAVFAIIQIPYQSLIIAYEKMNIFAFISVAEIILKLILTLSLYHLGQDKLILYAVIILATAAPVFMLYYILSQKLLQKNIACRFEFDKKLFTEMILFSSWYLFGGIAFLFMFQGGNILVNIFFGTLANSAMGIAFQIHGAITAFSGNIRQAIEPRIVKNFATNDTDSMLKTTFIGARYTFYLLWLFVLPGLCDIEAFLNIWLKSVPPQSILFCRLIMIFILVQTFDLSFSSIFKATGRIRENQIFSGMVYLLTLPLVYTAFYFKMHISSLFFIQIAAAFIVSFLVKFILMSVILKVPCQYYFTNVLFPLAKTLLPSIIVAVIFIKLFPAGILRGILQGSVQAAVLFLSCLYFDLKKPQRQQILDKMHKKLNVFFKREQYI